MQYLEDNQLFADIYRCVTSPSQWVPLLDQVKERMNVASVALQIYKKQYSGALDLKWDIRDSFSLEHSALHDKWVNNPDNPRLQLDISLPLQVVRDDDVFTEDCPVFNRFLERLALAGLGKAIMLDITLPNDIVLSLIAHRHCDDVRPYDLDIENFLYSLAPHLSQVIRLTEQFSQCSSQRKLLENVTNRFCMGVAILDSQANVMWLNDVAQHLIENTHGLALHNQQLRLLGTFDQASFRDYLVRAVAQPSMEERYIMALNTAEGESIEMMLSPLPNAHNIDLEFALDSTQHVIVYLKGPEYVPLNPKEVQSLFALTPAEAGVAVALAEGQTLSDYAEQKGIAIGTARIQLKSIFSKMNINRQPELVRKLWSSVSAASTPLH